MASVALAGVVLVSVVWAVWVEVRRPQNRGAGIRVLVGVIAAIIAGQIALVVMIALGIGSASVRSWLPPISGSIAFGYLVSRRS